MQSFKQPPAPSKTGTGAEEAGTAAELDRALAALADAHGFSEATVTTLWDAIVRGRGSMAQFRHPDLGGAGQWMRNGMVMVGDMFNQNLAARVAALCEDLAQLLAVHPSSRTLGRSDDDRAAPWWPAGWHAPAVSGAQGGHRYAWFPQRRQLIVERNDAREIYDTADHVITGVSQQQGASADLVFTSRDGRIDLGSLRRVAATAAPAETERTAPSDHRGALASPALAPAARSAGPAEGGSSAAASHDQIFDVLSKLAELHAKGVLTDEEFASKKTELLGRL